MQQFLTNPLQRDKQIRLRIKILKCTNPASWYKSAIGKNMDCFKITDNSEALILGHVVDSIDGGDEGAAGYVEEGDFVIFQEDNVQPQS